MRYYFSAWRFSFILLSYEDAEGPFPDFRVHCREQESKCNVWVTSGRPVESLVGGFALYVFFRPYQVVPNAWISSFRADITKKSLPICIPYQICRWTTHT